MDDKVRGMEGPVPCTGSVQGIDSEMLVVVVAVAVTGVAVVVDVVIVEGIVVVAVAVSAIGAVAGMEAGMVGQQDDVDVLVGETGTEIGNIDEISEGNNSEEQVR